MIVLPRELVELRQFFERLPVIWRRSEEDDSYTTSLDNLEMNFFGQRPHLLMLLGFDEYRQLHASELPLDSEGEPMRTGDLFAGDIRYETFFRQRQSGAWQWFEGIATADVAQRWGGSREISLHFIEEGGDAKTLLPVTKLLGVVAESVERPTSDQHSLVLPQLWTRPAQVIQGQRLSREVGGLLRTLQDEQCSLEALTPRQLEELVAFLLEGRGMKIHVTPQTRDGGRDIIARGELVPGEPTILAVEVKKKAVVGIADVQRALYANRHYPALMVATSGRFSAGVVEQKDSSESTLRLILKDGVALAQWIRLHSTVRKR